MRVFAGVPVCARTLSCLLAAVALVACAEDDVSNPSPGGAAGESAGGTGGAGGSGAVDAGERGWRTETPMPKPLQEHSAVLHAARIWVAGGFAPAPTAEVWIYDPAARSWEAGPALPAPRHHLMLASDGQVLYALGGAQDVSFAARAEAWALRDETAGWEPIAALPAARAAGIGGVVDGRVVVAGGYGDGFSMAPNAIIYDPVGDAWSSGAAIPTPREHLTGFVHGGELWSVGGRLLSQSTNLGAVEAYDVVADAWRASAELPTPRGGFGTAVLDGRAYAMGGETPSDALDVVEVFDLATETWSGAEPMPTRRHGHAVVAAAGRLYAIAGADVPNFGAHAIVESFLP